MQNVGEHVGDYHGTKKMGVETYSDRICMIEWTYFGNIQFTCVHRVYNVLPCIFKLYNVFIFVLNECM